MLVRQGADVLSSAVRDLVVYKVKLLSMVCNDIIDFQQQDFICAELEFVYGSEGGIHNLDGPYYVPESRE